MVYLLFFKKLLHHDIAMLSQKPHRIVKDKFFGLNGIKRLKQ